ncbi:MAG: hypothetical protein BWK75_04200 [Candidatus Altiarchaeales archaeon A3]|nr:MAG: hypothetical protein BWK75_04200 [Candidatus Altiarchaeales archaeon A3]
MKNTMKTEIKLYEPGLEEYPKSGIIVGNFMMILWIALGTIACYFFHPLIALVYFAFAIMMVFVVLRKLVCTNCYYYGKRCSIGWGKLSALFFKKGDIEKFSTSIGIKLAPLTYGLLTLVPIVLIIISIIQEFTIPKITVMIFLLLISFYSGAISRKKSCENCKMRLICPGCAVK